MLPVLPLQIETRALGHGVRFLLPRRNLGGGKFVGLIVMAFGIFFAGMALRMMLPAVGEIVRKGFDLGAIFGFLFSIPFLLGGLIPTAIGCFILFGRTEIEIADGRISTREVAGPFRWKRWRSIKGVQRLEVVYGAAQVNGKTVKEGPWAKMAGIKVEFSEGKPMLVALLYPVELLQPMADELARRIGDANVLSGGLKPTVAVVESTLGEMKISGIESAIEEDVVQPPTSRIKLEESANGTMITIPPAGLRKGSKGLFFFSIIWNAFVLFFIVIFTSGSGRINASMLLFLAFISIFVLIGVAILLSAINMGRRRAMILVSDRLLKCVQKSIFGTKKFEWTRDEIAAIRAGPSGMEVNDVPVLELQIHPPNGKPQGFFSGRDEQELRWLASVLRKRMSVPASRDESVNVSEH